MRFDPAALDAMSHRARRLDGVRRGVGCRERLGAVCERYRDARGRPTLCHGVYRCEACRLDDDRHPSRAPLMVVYRYGPDYCPQWRS